jgi:hypothetical protein
MELYPEYLDELKCWTKSNNHWMRGGRFLYYLAKQGKYLDILLQIADLLFTKDWNNENREWYS